MFSFIRSDLKSAETNKLGFLQKSRCTVSSTQLYSQSFSYLVVIISDLATMAGIDFFAGFAGGEYNK